VNLRKGATFSFDSPSEILAVDHFTSADTTWRTLTDVLSVGGMVLAASGDTLIVEPNLIVLTAKSSSEKQRLITKRERGLPCRVIIVLGPNVRVSDFGWRTRTSDTTQQIIHFALFIVPAVAFAGMIFGRNK
jgi:hypothetical protein